ncbi:Hypothetical protein PHPALM_14410 [Phytophthora palmivora]|uniref:Reverse transcriptase RNase H-like domain-containing protein n=1 Tax=Phytophthora palmivora TaxID=4796 RepID=A0A2P4XUR2_9STRA|nr:Hypothetical protein PHPALM_14410 [Phytophthora palmivora]
MRSELDKTSISPYSDITGPLYNTLELAMKISGSRKKSKLRKTKLDGCQWGPQELSSLQSLKKALISITPLAHLRADWEVSRSSGGSREDQRHATLAFPRGKFGGAASRWAIVEKESFVIAEACQRLDYILLSPGGFKLITDYRNLVYNFNPADTLQRWALSLSSFNYEIKHANGGENVWRDLLSRWAVNGDELPLQLRQLAVIDEVSPLQDVNFDWATPGTPVQDEAIAFRTPEGISLDPDSDLYETSVGKIWPPP